MLDRIIKDEFGLNALPKLHTDQNEQNGPNARNETNSQNEPSSQNGQNEPSRQHGPYTQIGQNCQNGPTS